MQQKHKEKSRLSFFSITIQPTNESQQHSSNNQIFPSEQRKHKHKNLIISIARDIDIELGHLLSMSILYALYNYS